MKYTRIASVRKKKKPVMTRMTLNRLSTAAAWVETPSGIHQPTNGATKNSSPDASITTPNRTAQSRSTMKSPRRLRLSALSRKRVSNSIQVNSHLRPHGRVGEGVHEIDHVP